MLCVFVCGMVDFGNNDFFVQFFILVLDVISFYN